MFKNKNIQIHKNIQKANPLCLINCFCEYSHEFNKKKNNSNQSILYTYGYGFWFVCVIAFFTLKCLRLEHKVIIDFVCSLPTYGSRNINNFLSIILNDLQPHSICIVNAQPNYTSLKISVSVLLNCCCLFLGHLIIKSEKTFQKIYWIFCCNFTTHILVIESSNIATTTERFVEISTFA